MLRRLGILAVLMIIAVFTWIVGTRLQPAGNNPLNGINTKTIPISPVPVFAHYYLWWDQEHWKAKLGPAYPYGADNPPLPARLDDGGCAAGTAYPGNTLTDIPAAPLGLYNQDDPAVLAAHVKTAASAGINGFVVSWSGNGQSYQSPQSTPFNRRLENLVSQVSDYNRQHPAQFYLILGYEGLDNTRNTRPPDAIRNDWNYFLNRYGNNPVFRIPAYGAKPVLVFLDSRKFSVTEINSLTPLVSGKARLIGDEHGPAEWDRGAAADFAGDSWYFSSQNPQTNNGVFRQMVNLAGKLRKDHKLWMAPLSAGYNKSNFGLGGTCVPRRNGQTLAANYRGNRDSRPDGWFYISWNEFLEGTYLEPSLRYGDDYLRQLRAIINPP